MKTKRYAIFTNVCCAPNNSTGEKQEEFLIQLIVRDQIYQYITCLENILSIKLLC